MAKKEEKKPVAPVTLENATTDNIVDILHQSNTVKDGTLAKVNEKIKEEKDVRLQQKLKIRLLDSQYNEALSLLKMRKSRRDESIKLDELRIRGNMRRQLCGAVVDETFVKHNKLDESKKEFDIELYSKDKKNKLVYEKTHVKVGEPIPSIDWPTYDEAYSDLNDKLRTRQNESDAEYAKDKKDLDAYFGNEWGSDWRYDRF